MKKKNGKGLAQLAVSRIKWPQGAPVLVPARHCSCQPLVGLVHWEIRKKNIESLGTMKFELRCPITITLAIVWTKNGA